jgi:Suppressor of fused protein (SUFU)
MQLRERDDAEQDAARRADPRPRRRLREPTTTPEVARREPPPEQPAEKAADERWAWATSLVPEVSLGLSELYSKQSKGDWSGFGYELTLRLAKTVGEEEVPLWPINILVNMARAAQQGDEADGVRPPLIAGTLGVREGKYTPVPGHR